MVSYFAMATGLGQTFVPVHYHNSKASIVHLFRQVYWARKSAHPHSYKRASSGLIFGLGYIDWLFTTPLLLISLAVLAGLSPSDTLLAVLADVFMIVTGLMGGLVPARWAPGERARWGWFGVSCVGFLVVWWVLFTGGLKGESSIDASRPFV